MDGTLGVAQSDLIDLGRRAKQAGRVLTTASGAAKDSALSLAADLLEERMGALLDANATDVDSAETAGATATQLDRLKLSEARVRAMAQGLRVLSAMDEVVGEVVEGYAPERPYACSGCGSRSASWASSTRTGPTSQPTPPACVSRPAMR